MRKIKAFLVALLLFAVTVIGCHFYIKDKASVDSTAFSTMPSEEKGKLRAALTENMSENGYPIFGSSEFQHGKENFYHPSPGVFGYGLSANADRGRVLSVPEPYNHACLD